MPARATLSLVEGVIELDASVVPDDAAFSPFASAAHALVTQCCEGENGPDTPYSEAHLTEIETWLAAHIYTTRDPRASSEAAGSVNASYQSRIDLGFSNSHYGQMAMRLDWHGGLARLDRDILKGGKRRVSADWLGTPFSVK